MIDTILATADAALRTMFATPHASRACPTLPGQASQLSAEETDLLARTQQRLDAFGARRSLLT